MNTQFRLFIAALSITFTLGCDDADDTAAVTGDAAVDATLQGDTSVKPDASGELPDAGDVADSGEEQPDGEAPGPDAAPTFEFNEAEATAAAIAFEAGGFTRISDTPESSAHAADTVSIWVSDGAAEGYRAIDPDSDEPTDPMAPGTIIVKQHHTANGGPGGLTVMAKAHVGYAPETDDWWWARIENNGDVPFGGQVGFCVNCHTPRQDTDWLFGVPSANQTE